MTLTLLYLMALNKIQRYGIYYADLNPAIGSEINKIHPVVVISKNDMNKFLDTVVICPMTSKIHIKWRSRIQVKNKRKPVEIAIDQIRTISKIRLKKGIGKLNNPEAFKLRCLITEMYGE